MWFIPCRARESNTAVGVTRQDGMGKYCLRPNGLRVSCAAPIDRDDRREETAFQNRHDLGAAKRRQLHALVRRLAAVVR